LKEPGPYDLTRELLRHTRPLAATSANLSGQESAHNSEEVRENRFDPGRGDLAGRDSLHGIELHQSGTTYPARRSCLLAGVYQGYR